MKIPIARFAVLLAVIPVIAGCAASYSKITERRPVFHPVPPGTGTLATAEAGITKALRRERGQLTSLDEYLAATQAAEERLKRDPHEAAAIRDYDFAVGRIVEVIHDARLTPWSKPLRVAGDHGDFELVDQRDPRREWNPALFEFTPADQFDVGGKYVTERTTRDGIGAPAVAAELQATTTDRRQDFAPSQIYRCVTVIARFNGRRCTLSFEDPLDTETVTLDGHTFALAADFTVPLAVMLDRTDPQKHELSRLLNPGKYAHTAAIERLQPYSPDKTIVLVIHGLKDSQATWTPMINTLRGDRVIRQHYQFWFYSYPSGYPYPYSAAILREQLDALEKRYPSRKSMVVIGHSMGGCISRLLLTDTGEQLWIKIFGKPPDDVPLPPKLKEQFKEALIFKHRPEIGRVIFISAPLKGSNLAGSWLGRIGSSLIRAPGTLRDAGEQMLGVTPAPEEDELKLKRFPNSIDTLAPNSRFVKAINTIPMVSGVPYHSIMGDRGRGDTPNSSDGVVAYWSSHLAGAQSELIVPSDHSSHQNRQAIQEVRRILKKYAGSSDGSDTGKKVTINEKM
jgi:pimeloyl-ACP methyl ester carboxylesterase